MSSTARRLAALERIYIEEGRQYRDEWTDALSDDDAGFIVTLVESGRFTVDGRSLDQSERHRVTALLDDMRVYVARRIQGESRWQIPES